MTRDKSDNLMRWATRASVTVASTLVMAKAVAWWLSDSVAMLGSMTDSGLDLMASLVTLFAVRTALLPPDEDHRFGHGKAEALAGLFQAAIMSGSAVFLLLESINHVAVPHPVAQSTLVMGVSVLAIVLSLVLVSFQSYVVRHTSSLAVAGDHLHYKGDLLLNLSVILAAWATSSGFDYADGAFGILIALYILYGAKEIAVPAVHMLMDRELGVEDREKIFNLAMGNPSVRGLHELKTRMSGRDLFIQMHIEVDGEMTVHDAHFVADEVEAMIGEAYPDSEVLIHVDPPSLLSDQLTVKELGKIGE